MLTGPVTAGISGSGRKSLARLRRVSRRRAGSWQGSRAQADTCYGTRPVEGSSVSAMAGELGDLVCATGSRLTLAWHHPQHGSESAAHETPATPRCAHSIPCVPSPHPTHAPGTDHQPLHSTKRAARCGLGPPSMSLTPPPCASPTSRPTSPRAASACFLQSTARSGPSRSCGVRALLLLRRLELTHGRDGAAARGDEDASIGAQMTNTRRTKAGLSGFVAYMKRRDAEAAVKELDGLDWGGCVLRVGWSKAVRVPLRPIYGAWAGSRGRKGLAAYTGVSRRDQGRQGARAVSIARTASKRTFAVPYATATG